MEIEYLEKFRELQDESHFRGQQWFGKRKSLVQEYSWAVPTEEVIIYLAEFDHLWEIGAGNGYWANLIHEAGGSVHPLDIDPPDETHMHVDIGAAYELFEHIQNEPVLMVWPPYDDGMAYRVAKREPSHICYVGEQRGGCTASDEFFDIIEREYGLVGKIDLPSYAGVHDDFYHYARKI